MPLQAKCFSGFKFCSSSKNRDSNYDYLPYCNEQVPTANIIAPINNFTSKKKNLNIAPMFHSTHIMESKNRTTGKKTTKVLPDIDPALSQIRDVSNYSSSFNSISTSTFCSECTSDYSSNNYSNESVTSSSSNEINLANEDTLYVCCIAYKPKIQGDLNLAFADRVKLIHMNDDFALVENVLTKKCGYVPRFCLSTMSQFLRELKYLNHN